jgi:hypothetical protein
VLVFTPDSLVFSNNTTWLDAASLSAFTDVLLAAGTVHAVGNRLQECIGATLLSGITFGLANITSQNICTNCLLAGGLLTVKTGNIVLLNLGKDEGVCTGLFTSAGLEKWTVPGT